MGTFNTLRVYVKNEGGASEDDGERTDGLIS